MKISENMKSTAIFGYSFLAFVASMFICYFVPILFAKGNPELYSDENPGVVNYILWAFTFGILISGVFISLYVAVKAEALVTRQFKAPMAVPGVILGVTGCISAFIAIAFAIVAAIIIYYFVIVMMVFIVALGVTGAVSGRK